MQIEGVLLREVLHEGIYRSIAVTGNLIIVKVSAPQLILVLGIYVHDIAETFSQSGVVVKEQAVAVMVFPSLMTVERL